MIKFLLTSLIVSTLIIIIKKNIALIGIIDSITRELPDNLVFFLKKSLQTGVTTYIFIRIFYTVSKEWFSNFDCIYRTKRITMDMRRLN